MTMFLNTVRLALRSTLSNKMRSFLTMLGIIIGVVAVVMLMSISNGATQTITDAISSMGTDRLTIMVTNSDVSLKAQDYDGLLEYSDYIAAVSPYLSISGTARYKSEYTSASAVGVTENYMSINDMELQAGRGIVPSDLEWRTDVAVIGTEIAEELYESYDVIGKTLTMNGKTFTVVGLLEEAGTTLTGSLDSSVLIPLTSAQRISDTTDITTVYVKSVSSDVIEQAQTVAELYMKNLTQDEDSYSVFNLSQLLDTLDTVMNTMSLMLGGIAAISLIVGGIGIMNIMLVSVAERIREIGIRKAIGAKRGHILSQFLIEAVVLSVMGGLIGLLVSEIGMKVVSHAFGTELNVDFSVAVGALLFCTVIGVIFGIYPANKASKLTPIDALQRK